MWTENIQTQEDSNLSCMDPSDFCSHSLSTPPQLQFGCSTFLGVGHSFSNYPVTSFHFLKELPVFPHFGLSNGLICRIKVSEKFRSQQDSNLRRKTRSDFESDALTTRPWLHDGVLTFICAGHSLLNCCVNSYFLKVLPNYPLLGASDRSMSSVVWTEFFQSHQDSNISWTNPSGF